MRDPNRIPEMLFYLGDAWMDNPDLRLGQLLVGLVGTKDLFYVEDDKLLMLIQKLIDKNAEPK